MEELKTHLISENHKEKHNCVVEEIEAEFVCDECDINFPKKSVLESHLKEVHSGDSGGKADTSRLEEIKGETADVSSSWSGVSCDKMFKFEIESQEHFNIEHCRKDIEVIGDFKKENSISNQEVKNGFFERELIPKNNTKKEVTGVIFRAESEEYDEAQRILEKIFKNPTPSLS